jgi:hypothetical protein
VQPRFPLGRVRPSGVPRRHRYYQGRKTPCVEYGVTYVFASPLPSPVPLGSLPISRDLQSGLAPLSATAPSAIWIRVECRGSQVPGKSIPYLCHALRFRPVRPTSPYRSAQCCPRYSDHEDTRDTYFGTQYRGFGIRCLRFKWCVTAPACKTGFRLVVSHCREGVEPSGLQRKVSIHYIGFPFPRLILARRKVRPKRSAALKLRP